MIVDGQTAILVDAGISYRRIAERMANRCGLTPQDLDAILISHEHADHVRGLPTLLKRTEAPVYMTSGTFDALNGMVDRARAVLLEPLVATWIRGVRVVPAPVLHDAAQPVGFVFDGDGVRAGILTDLGNLYRESLALYEGLDLLVLEFNHDPAMLRQGPYPPRLKARIASERGHLSNEHASQLLEIIGFSSMKHLILAHLSENNNTPSLALEAARRTVADAPVRIHVADREGLRHAIEVGTRTTTRSRPRPLALPLRDP